MAQQDGKETGIAHVIQWVVEAWQTVAHAN